MFLQISTTHTPATDLGFLLAKHPEKVNSFNLSFGTAYGFYPEVSEAKCTFALLLDVDPVALSRSSAPKSSSPLLPYVNDRPYVASSFTSVAIAQVLRSALIGQSRERPELASEPMPLEAMVSSVPAPNEVTLRGLFEPLGYEVSLDAVDEHHFSLILRHTIRLSELLSHLYVLLPVLDNDKHYFVGDDEVEKLLRRGAGWLESHPAREFIVTRYLKRKRRLVYEALERLAPDVEADDETATGADGEEERVEAELTATSQVTKGDEATEPNDVKVPLHQQRLEAVLELLKASGARKVLDLGCGEGQLLRLLMKEKSFETIIGMDASHRALDIAADKLRLDRMPDLQRARLTLLHGALTYRDDRLKGFDAAAIVEVVEHLDPPRLRAFERAVWEWARPEMVVLTTPNRDYNARWESLPAGTMRHRDHRFEWSRAEFEAWANGVGERWGYSVEIGPLGPLDDELGAPSQMAVFRRKSSVE